MTRTGLALLLLLVILTRLWFVFAGYGTDPDAWRVAEVATRLWHTCEYEMSRPPGYPLHEFLTAPLVSIGGAPLSNAATFLCSILLLIVFHRISLRGSHHPDLLVVILAFTPLFWKNSVVTMDYVPSLLFIMLALDQGLLKRTILAGIFLGIATGFRAGNITSVIPLSVIFLCIGISRRSLITFMFTFAVTCACCYIPIAITLGPYTWLAETGDQVARIRSHQDTSMLIAAYRGIYAFGPLAVGFVVWVLARCRSEMYRSLREYDPFVGGALIGAAVIIFQFAMLPMEREYLLPILPFGLLALDRVIPRRKMVTLGVILISYAFMNPDMIEHKGLLGRIHPNVRWGVIIEEIEKHRQREQTRGMILSIKEHHRCIVMTGFPNSFWFEDERVARVPLKVHEPVYRNRADSLTHHVLFLSAEEVSAVRSQGFEVYVLAGSERFIEQTGGYRLVDKGILLAKPSE